MSSQVAFVFVACGSEDRIRALHRSLEHLRPRTRANILVVTDTRRNRLAIRHDAVVDIETPHCLSDHRASVFLKTSLHQLVPAQHRCCYLDTDVLAVGDGVDAVFEHARGSVTFARDLVRLESRFGTFSPWAVNCPCDRSSGSPCDHLAMAAERKFGVRIPRDWAHWNGGVFLFGPESSEFMNLWHRLTLAIFEDPYWRTRDQATLAAAAWKLGIQHQECLPPRFNFIADLANSALHFDRDAGYSLHPSIPPAWPTLLHVLGSGRFSRDWDLKRDVEAVLEKRAQARAADSADPGRADRTFSLIAARLSAADREPDAEKGGTAASAHAKSDTTASSITRILDPGPFQVIAAAPDWGLNGLTVATANLVRGLNARGVPAQVLLTELNSDRVAPHEPQLPFPEDLPKHELPLSREASWGSRWGALVRYLEQREPCVYLPNADWRHSIVSPHLSNGVRIVGIVPCETPGHLDHVRRLGHYWDQIVATSSAIAARLAALDPALAGRITTIPAGACVPDDPPERASDDGQALRAVYLGRLVQRQKRVLDLPRIVAATLARGVSIQLTVVGDGPEREKLIAESRALVERGAIRILGLLPHHEVLQLLERQDALIITSELEGIPNSLIEAMGRGCVPVVTRTGGGVTALVRNGKNGYLVPIGAVQGFAECLADLHGNPERRRALGIEAHRSVLSGGHRIEDMVTRYEGLFRRLLLADASHGSRRPHGLLSKPPYQVSGAKIFPIYEAKRIGDFGVFPHRRDYEDYRKELSPLPGRRLPPSTPALLRRRPVIVAINARGSSTALASSVALLRGLRDANLEAQALVLVRSPAERPPDLLPAGVPVETLCLPARLRGPAGPPRLVGHLSRQAPCIHLIDAEEQRSLVGPDLPHQVAVAGIVRGGNAPHYELLVRFAPHWKAVVATSPGIAAQLTNLDPSLASRLVTIPDGVDIRDRLPRRPLAWGEPLRIVHRLPREPRAQSAGELASVLDALSDRGVPTELTVTGKEEEWQRLAQACRRDGARESLRFAGEELADQELLELFESSDVYLLTDDIEGLPRDLVLAMGRGCVPVLKSIRNSEPHLLRHGECAYFVPGDDPGTLADRLGALQINPALRRSLAAAAHEAVDRGGLRVADMVTGYLLLVDRMLRELDEAGSD